MNKKIYLYPLLLALTFCSSGGDSEFFSLIYPSGLSVTSPTIGSSDSSSSNALIAIGNIDSTSSFEEKNDTLAELASGNSECTFVFPSFDTPFNDPECHGPKLYYRNHPDGPDEAPVSGDPWPSLPAGDLGMWSTSENGEACAAAKMNQEIGNVGQKVDAALLFVAGMSCLIESDTELSIPEVNQTTDLTEALAEAIADDNPSLTIDSATLERTMDAANGFAVYQYEISVEAPSNRFYTINLKQHPTNDTGSTYKGKLWTSFETGSPTEFEVNNSFAFSMLFERTDDNLLYQLLSTTYSRATVTGEDMFNTNNDLSPSACSGANCWEDFAQTIASIDTDTGFGTISHAWQASTLDADGATPLARIFQFYTEEEEDETVGYAFFGFGRGFSPNDASIGSNTINRYICNWSGPGNDRSGEENLAQKQVMQYDTSARRFVADDSNITYAPRNSCNYDGEGTFAYSTDVATDLTNGANEAGEVTNNLVNISSDADFDDYVAPTIPTEDF